MKGLADKHVNEIKISLSPLTIHEKAQWKNELNWPLLKIYIHLKKSIDRKLGDTFAENLFF